MLDHPKKNTLNLFPPPVKCTLCHRFGGLKKNDGHLVFLSTILEATQRSCCSRSESSSCFFFRKNSSHTDVCCLKQPAELFQRPSNRQHFPPWTLKKRTKAPRNASCLPTQADKWSPSQDPSADRWGASILFSPQTSLIYPCKTSLLHGLQDFLHILLVCLGLVKRQVGSPSFLAKSRNQKNSYWTWVACRRLKKNTVLCVGH